MNTKSTLTPSPILKDIISVYSDLWADVMLGKNLESHRKKIEVDLYFIDHLVAEKQERGEDNSKIVKIANQLYCLRLIILKKLKLRV